ncbi:MAG TPA: uroporphyrinogen decarboxylase family protein [Clostridia bacterium]|nr:uroporphyrinogen decarboxylase family protein [Clostridia bacterium]
MDSVDSKVKVSLDRWASGEGIQFVNSDAETAYKSRARRVADAILLKKPDRVPVVPLMEFFYARHAGVSAYDVLYNPEIATWASKKTILDMEPDVYESPFHFNSGRLFEVLGMKQMKWPGHGVSYSSAFQFVEDEYMKADEYELLINDPSDFMMRKFLPRACGNLSGFQYLSPIRNMFAYYTMYPQLAGFATPEGVSSLETLAKAAEASLDYVKFLNAFNEEMNSLGYPAGFGAFALAPFDAISDTLRGTHGAMIDMYRQPDLIKEACDRFVWSQLDMAVSTAKLSNHPVVFIPLHKGTATTPDGKGGFMSLEQFEEFYWPSLKKLIEGLVANGLVPNLFVEGDYTSRLDIIKDVPRGSCIYHFEKIDIERAKETLGDTVCIRGSVPIHLMWIGDSKDVKDYCKKLIDVAGEGGGFLMDISTASEDAKSENMKAMIDFTKEYGVYK